MKINSINNNSQNRQSFGATANITLKKELRSILRLTSSPQELVTFFREERKLAAQVPPQDFASRFKAIKAIGMEGEEVDPHVLATELHGSPESATIYFNVKLPNPFVGFQRSVQKTKEESPRAFLDKFLTLVQENAEGLQHPKDVEKAADKGINTFLEGLIIE